MLGCDDFIRFVVLLFHLDLDLGNVCGYLELFVPGLPSELWSRFAYAVWSIGGEMVVEWVCVMYICACICGSREVNGRETSGVGSGKAVLDGE